MVYRNIVEMCPPFGSEFSLGRGCRSGSLLCLVDLFVVWGTLFLLSRSVCLPVELVFDLLLPLLLVAHLRCIPFRSHLYLYCHICLCLYLFLCSNPNSYGAFGVTFYDTFCS